MCRSKVFSFSAKDKVPSFSASQVAVRDNPPSESQEQHKKKDLPTKGEARRRELDVRHLASYAALANGNGVPAVGAGEREGVVETFFRDNDMIRKQRIDLVKRQGNLIAKRGGKLPKRAGGGGEVGLPLARDDVRVR